MKKLAILSLLAACVGANAFTYSEHDGTSEISLGLTAGGNIAWVQGFQVSGGNNVLTSISTTFGTPAFLGVSGVTAGQAFSVHVWTGTGADPNVGRTYVGSWASTINAGSIDTDVLQTVAINANLGAASWFFIGADVNHTVGGFPAPEDTSTPLSGNSWVGGGGAGPFDPNNPASGLGGSLLNLGAIGFPSDWVIEANAVPEPASMAVLGLGLAAMARRRRK